MTHLGQRLSALIDGELHASERERAFVHLTACGSCQDDYAALWALKRRMREALNETAAGAGLVGLTSRLVGLRSDLLGLDSRLSGGSEAIWPPPAPPGGWPTHERPQDATPADRDRHPDRGGRLPFVAGSIAIFLAGLSTAAVIAGGEAQARAPAPPVTPSVDVLVAPHSYVNQGATGGSDVLAPRPVGPWSRPQDDLPGQP